MNYKLQTTCPNFTTNLTLDRRDKDVCEVYALQTEAKWCRRLTRYESKMEDPWLGLNGWGLFNHQIACFDNGEWDSDERSIFANSCSLHATENYKNILSEQVHLFFLSSWFLSFPRLLCNDNSLIEENAKPAMSLTIIVMDRTFDRSVYWPNNPLSMLGEHSKSLQITRLGSNLTKLSSILPASQVGHQKAELLSASLRVILGPLSCSPNFLHASR